MAPPEDLSAVARALQTVVARRLQPVAVVFSGLQTFRERTLKGQAKYTAPFWTSPTAKLDPVLRGIGASVGDAVPRRPRACRPAQRRHKYASDLSANASPARTTGHSRPDAEPSVTCCPLASWARVMASMAPGGQKSPRTPVTGRPGGCCTRHRDSSERRLSRRLTVLPWRPLAQKKRPENPHRITTVSAGDNAHIGTYGAGNVHGADRDSEYRSVIGRPRRAGLRLMLTQCGCMGPLQGIVAGPTQAVVLKWLIAAGAPVTRAASAKSLLGGSGRRGPTPMPAGHAGTSLARAANWVRVTCPGTTRAINFG